MPNTSSANKAMRQSRRRNVINKRTKSKFKSAIKNLRGSIAEKDMKKSAEQLKVAMATLDKAVKKGVIHKNTADRKKSRLAKSVNKISK